MLGVEVAAPDVGVTALESSSQLFLLNTAKNLSCSRLLASSLRTPRSGGPWCFAPFRAFFIFKSSSGCCWPRRPRRTNVASSQIVQKQPTAGGMSGRPQNPAGVGDSATQPVQGRFADPGSVVQGGGWGRGTVLIFSRSTGRGVHVKVGRWPAFRVLQFPGICRPLPQPLAHSQTVFVSPGRPTSCHLASQESSGIK